MASGPGNENFVSFVEFVRAQASELQTRCNDALDDSFKPAAHDALASADSLAKSQHGNDVTLSSVADALLRSRRDQLSQTHAIELFQDPAWDIMLDLYIAHTMQKYVSVTSAGFASHTPQTTALRLVWHLESLSLIERKADPKDKRRYFVMLTKAGIALIEQILGAYKSQFRQLFNHPPIS